jgi:predicted dehydrogenase
MIIKIIGSGSAGNHIAFAFKKFAKKIYMFDLTASALRRSKKIYISRYKKWNNNIIQDKNTIDRKFYDLVVISTPPNTHLKILKNNIYNSNNFLIEKPLFEPNKFTIDNFIKIKKKFTNKKFFCGYNHRLFPSTQKLKDIINQKKSPLDIIEVNFKENTAGFLQAHYWLKDLSKSYLSKYKHGGGALLEHSHALNLAQYLCEDQTQIKIIYKNIEFIKNRKVFYDKSSQIILKSNKNLVILNQNFETQPTEKNITVSNKNIFAKLIYNFNGSDDRIILYDKIKKKLKIYNFKKKRSDDFKYEAKFIAKAINNQINKKNNPLNIDYAISTIRLILKIFKS